MSVAWTDYFADDHFHDGRYNVFAGIDPGPGNVPGAGSWYIDGSGLEASWIGWDDPTYALGDSGVAYVELTLAGWDGISSRVGFAPPGNADGSVGVYVALSHADVGISLTLHDGWSDIGHYFSSDLTRHNPDTPIVIRLAIDPWGVAYMGVGGPGGWFLPEGISKILGSFGQISEDTALLLPTFVPMSYIAGANRATAWRYAMGAGVKPSDIAAQQAPGGIVGAVAVPIGGNPPGHGAIP